MNKNIGSMPYNLFWQIQYIFHFVFSQFDLVCSNAWLVDMFQATLNVGFLVGSIAIGYLADRLGYDCDSD